MHILLIGASGRTGKVVMEEALSRGKHAMCHHPELRLVGQLICAFCLTGHTLTALVRNPDSLQPRDGVTIVKGKVISQNCDAINPNVVAGTALNKDDIESAFSATPSSPPTAVIVTLNAQRKSDNPWAAPVAPPRMMADSNANITSVMKAHSVRKIVVMSAFGVAESFNNMNILLRLTIRHSNMSYQFEDHGLVDKEMKERQDIDWVIARPTMLAEGAALPVKEWGNDGAGVGLTMKITRGTVASFLVDAAEKDKWNHTTPVLTN